MKKFLTLLLLFSALIIVLVGYQISSSYYVVVNNANEGLRSDIALTEEAILATLANINNTLYILSSEISKNPTLIKSYSKEKLLEKNILWMTFQRFNFELPTTMA